MEMAMATLIGTICNRKTECMYPCWKGPSEFVRMAVRSVFTALTSSTWDSRHCVGWLTALRRREMVFWLYRLVWNCVQNKSSLNFMIQLFERHIGSSDKDTLHCVDKLVRSKQEEKIIWFGRKNVSATLVDPSQGIWAQSKQFIALCSFTQI